MNRTYVWWKFLCGIAIINIFVWLTAIWFRPETQTLSYLQPILSGLYVSICAFRSFYPRIDLERYCLFDTPLSSVVLGRSAATIAEISFSVQCALLIFDLGLFLDASLITYVAYAIVPLIVVAQAFCWYATLSQNHFWHAMEEVTWVVMIALATACFIYGFIELSGFYQLLMAVGIISCVGSAYIMLFIDIPMYLSRRREGAEAGQQYFTFTQGMSDALRRRVQTSDWTVWKKEALWITPYFTVGVWLSIAMLLVNFNG